MRKIHMWLDVCEALAEYSTCVKRKVGCVLTDQYYRVVGSGYNGVPAGIKHCTTHPCPGAGTKRGSNMCMAMHAEQNAIANMKDKPHYCFTNVKPCEHCLKLLIAAGIKTVYFIEDYESPNELYKTIKMVKVER